MAAQHKLTIAYDEATGALAVGHRCTVAVAGHVVSHERAIELGEGAATALREILDANRTVVETEASALAIAHVAAVEGKKQHGITPLKVAGSVSGLGGATVDKKE